MKKRILFVDDESLVLQGLQRMLRNMRHEWDMVFVASGAEALAAMEEAPADAVVSDMRMPGMNGAELLHAIMQRWPSTVRLILSGHADQDLVVRSVGSAHQYLSKPCEAGVLQRILTRAFDLESAVRNERLQQLAGKMDRLPSLPSVYVEIVEATRSTEVSVEDVGEIVARDIAMTAKVLHLVNSAFFGLPRQISSPGQAVAYLGLDTIRALVLSLHAFGQFDSSPVNGFSLDALWTHSLEVASGAKRLGLLEALPRKAVDEAFVAGLLHDIGKIVLACNFQDEYSALHQQASQHSRAMVEAELEAFGADHAEVGGYLLGLWGLPNSVVEAITYHHHPHAGEGAEFTALTAVHVANAISKNSNGNAGEFPLDMDYLNQLSLANRVEPWRSALAANN